MLNCGSTAMAERRMTAESGAHIAFRDSKRIDQVRRIARTLPPAKRPEEVCFDERFDWESQTDDIAGWPPTEFDRRPRAAVRLGVI